MLGSVAVCPARASAPLIESDYWLTEPLMALETGPKRAVKTLPLSDKIWSETPWVRGAHWSASHTGLAVARATTRA